MDTHLECRRGCGGDPLTARQCPRSRASALDSSRPPGPGAAASRLPSLPRAPGARVGTAPRAGLQAVGGEVAAPDSRGPGSGAVGQVAPSRPAPAFLHWEAAGGPSSSGRPGAQGRPRGCAFGAGAGSAPGASAAPRRYRAGTFPLGFPHPRAPRAEEGGGEGKERGHGTPGPEPQRTQHRGRAPVPKRVGGTRATQDGQAWPRDAGRRVEHPGAPRSRRSPHRRAARRTGRGRRGSLRDLGAASYGLLIE